MRKLVLFPIVSLILAACGGGGGDSGGGGGNGGGNGGSYTITGKVSVIDSSTLDSDTNDPTQPGYASNDTPSVAQTIPNPTLVVGHMTKQGQGPTGPNFDFGDVEDYYRVNLQVGQVIELEFAADSATMDLDLYLFNAGTSSSTLAGQSVGVNKYECIRVNKAGAYYINVSMFQSGSTAGSVYQLRVSAPGTGNAACPNVSASGDGTDGIVAGELVAQMNAQHVTAAANGVSPKAALDSAVVIASGEVQANRPVLLALPQESAAAQRGLNTLAAKVTRRKLAAQGVSIAAIASKSAAELEATYANLSRTDLSENDRRVLQTVAMAKLLRTTGDYDYVEFNNIVKSQQATLIGDLPSNDAFYSRQKWHYELINLPSALQAIKSMNPAPTVRPIVAVLDTGVVLTHPDLSSQMVPGYDFIPASSSGDGDGLDSNADDSSRSSTTPSFHGTHVAGTVAAQGFNAQGGLGVAPMALIMPVRVLGERGTGNDYSVMQGMRFAAGLANDSGTVPARRADVMNLSLGSQSSCSSAYASLVAAIRAAGTIIVAASGNDSNSNQLYPIGAPANCTNVMSVGAVGPNKTRSQFSNGGSGLWIAAPGGDFTNFTGNPGGDQIYSTVAEFRGSTRVATYGVMSGTSMASPHVAGVMALMRYVHPSITVAQIDNALANFQIVDDIGAAGRDSSFGLGLVNARKAVDVALALRGGSVTPPSGFVQAQPSALNMGNVQSSLEVSIDRIGTSSETVSSVTVSSAVISVAPKSGAVNATTKLGTYVVTANRSAVPVGSTLFPEVVIQTNTGRTIRVPVTVENRTSAAVTGNLGPMYLLVYDANADADADAIADATVTTPVNGVYNYSITVTAAAGTSLPSSVYVYAGADLDNDGLICGGGEACGAYPVLAGLPQAISLTGNLNSIDFGVSPFGGITAQSAGKGTVRGKLRPIRVVQSTAKK